MESGNGLIEIGLCFSHISSQLRIHVISAEKLKAVNLLGGLSGQTFFAKLKQFDFVGWFRNIKLNFRNIL
jgi:hypothetical protein